MTGASGAEPSENLGASLKASNFEIVDLPVPIEVTTEDLKGATPPKHTHTHINVLDIRPATCWLKTF